MSTRYAGNYEFDHGAQYFTVDTSEFRNFIDAAIAAGAAAPWPSRALYLKSGKRLKDTGRDRYVGTPRMNSLPKFLAEKLNITLGCRVSKMSQTHAKWTLEFESGEVEAGFDAVICTAPPEQAQQLLPANFCEIQAIRTAKMHACFALMIGLSDAQFSWDSLRVGELSSQSPIAWMAVNSAKPARNQDAACLVIHAGALWSERHQDANRDWVTTQLLEAASQICDMDLSQAPHIDLHRWLYASVATEPNLKSVDNACLFDAKLNLAACGDWCLGGRVEGAWSSGYAAGIKVIDGFNLTK